MLSVNVDLVMVEIVVKILVSRAFELQQENEKEQSLKQTNLKHVSFFFIPI